MEGADRTILLALMSATITAGVIAAGKGDTPEEIVGIAEDLLIEEEKIGGD